MYVFLEMGFGNLRVVSKETCESILACGFLQLLASLFR